MYGYCSPKQLEPGSVRVMICESQIRQYLTTYSALTREQVLATMMAAGPMRTDVEKELRRVAQRALRAREG
jgi:hypothetical protein